MLIKSIFLALAASLAAAVDPLEIQGNVFVNPKTGTKFHLLGVAYQPGGSAGYEPTTGKDPLSNGDICMRDAALMQILGINAIRVYNLDPNLNHDMCASIFNAAGMYMIIDVNSPLQGESLTSVNPWESYYNSYLNRTFAIVEAFKDYPNTLLFFSGNEVIDKIANAKFVPQYVRAVTRDLKKYVKQHAARYIPVGYSAADVRDILFDSWNYFQCAIDGGEDDSRVDLFALNSYSWCGDSSFEKSTYDDLVSGFKSSSVPIFFSEFGCNEVTPRLFTEIGTIYGSQMTGVFAGGIVYEYSQEDNNFGLVKINSDGSANLLKDFDTLADQYKKIDFSKLQGQKPSGKGPSPPKCASSLIKEKGFSSNFTVPDMPADNSPDILKNGVSPKPVGKLIQISDYKVKLKVKSSDGKDIANLAVKPIDGANQPGTNDAKDDAGAFLKPTLLFISAPLLAALLL